MNKITTHILDVSIGKPAGDVFVELRFNNQLIGSGKTDSDGRAKNLLPSQHTLQPGIYCLKFVVNDYFASQSRDCFFPFVELYFEIKNVSEHYHVPLLLSPFGYSTYRGS